MSILKIKDKDGNWVEIPSLNVSVNRKSVSTAIPSLVEYIKDSDSPFLALNGEAIPIGRIAMGTYTGDGTYGKTDKEDNSIILTFDFEPKIVFVSATTAGSDSSGVLTQDTKIFFKGVDSVNTGWALNYTRLDVEWTSNSVKYCFNHTFSDGADEARHQLNKLGETYVFYAIG